MSPKFSAHRVKLALIASLAVAGVSAEAASAGSRHRFQAPGYGRPHPQGRHARAAAAGASATATPIKHLVVIFQENVSFDHYFATYPYAANRRFEPNFQASRETPTVNNLNTPLLDAGNPNSTQPFRLSRAQAATCDQDHEYADEQAAFDRGLMDLFVETVGVGSGTCADYGRGKGLVMGYYDGNTTTALWNYAQHFAMSDNSYNTTFGPSTPGAINLVSGQTHGVVASSGNVVGDLSKDGQTIEGDPQPLGDDCSTRETARLGGRNIGDLMNGAGITWGWFQGGFRPTSVAPGGKAVCGATHAGADGKPKGDYIAHHEPFQYYASTANPHHVPPSAPDKIGQTDQANHQYDVSDFWTAVDGGRMPSVSFLKAPGYQDGHAGYSSPLLEQKFLADAINRLERRPEWKNTAVVISYDDSDGWYDHQMSPIINQSQDPGTPGTGTGDALTGPGLCGTKAPAGGYQGRCGYGPRLPLLVVSPWAKRNFVDHGISDQTSILQAIEQNWGLPSIGDASFDQRAGSLVDLFRFDSERRTPPLYLDTTTGQATSGAAAARRGRHHRRVSRR